MPSSTTIHSNVPSRHFKVWANQNGNVSLDSYAPEGKAHADLSPNIARQLACTILSAANEIDPPEPASEWPPAYLSEDDTATALREVASAVRELADAKRYSEEGIRARRDAHADRRDNRQPDHPLTADQRRIAARDARRKARKETA